ncbi:MAG: GDCCVxC domain-containing (seleno)protein [Rickettsiales bacterium]
MIKTHSTIVCPECSFSKTEEMPTDSCQYFYECSKCHAILKPKEGDCCVFCSYGDAPCPSIQELKGKCCG